MYLQPKKSKTRLVLELVRWHLGFALAVVVMSITELFMGIVKGLWNAWLGIITEVLFFYSEMLDSWRKEWTYSSTGVFPEDEEPVSKHWRRQHVNDKQDS